MVIGIAASNPSFSAIKESMASGLSNQAISFSSTKGLYVQTGTSSDFLNAFRSRQHLDDRATLRQVAVDKIKDAIDREFGAGMGERAFAQAAASDASVTKELVKRDLEHLENAIKTLQAEDHAPANARLGRNGTIDGLFETGVRDGCLQQGRAIDDVVRNDLKNRMAAAVKSLPEDAPPRECRRAAQHVLLRYDLECEFNEQLARVPDDDREQERGQLNAHLTRLLGEPLERVPLRDAALVLREACADGDWQYCGAQLDQLGRRWTPADHEQDRTSRTSLSNHRGMSASQSALGNPDPAEVQQPVEAARKRAAARAHVPTRNSPPNRADQNEPSGVSRLRPQAILGQRRARVSLPEPRTYPDPHHDRSRSLTHTADVQTDLDRRTDDIEGRGRAHSVAEGLPGREPTMGDDADGTERDQ